MGIAGLAGKVAKTAGKGVGAVAGTATGLGSRFLKGGGGIIKEAASGVASGLKSAHGWASGSTGRIAKESAETAAKATKEATEQVAMKTKRLQRATDALNPNMKGPMPKNVVDDARKLNMVKNANDPNFIGPRPSDSQLRDANRYVQANMDPNFIGPMPIAQEMAESGAGWWSGLGEMIEEYPFIAAGIAGGTGVIAGGILLDDDDE